MYMMVGNICSLKTQLFSGGKYFKQISVLDMSVLEAKF